MISDFICNFGMLPFLSHLGKYIIKIGKISIKANFGLGMTPISKAVKMAE